MECLHTQGISLPRLGLGTFRMPLYLDDVRIRLRAWRLPDEENDLIAGMDQTLDQCPAQQAGSAAH